MYMKHLFPYILGGALLVTAAGCNKLDQSPYGSAIVSDQYYGTLEQCNTSTMVAYRYIDYSTWWEILNWRYLAGEAASDNGWVGNTYQTHPTYDAVAHFTLDPGNDRNEAQWVDLYKSIGRFNSTIEGISTAPISDDHKKQFIAELKFLRAWCYYDLIRNWGPVPLVLEILPPSTHLPRSSVQDVYNQIDKDLNECIAVLPKKGEYPAADRFRASRGAALTLLAKASLYMEDWPKAERLSQLVIDEKDYDLEPEFSTLWQYTYKNGIESIFEIQNGSSQVPALPFNQFQVMLNSPGDAGWGYYSVSSDLENAYKAEGDSIRLQWTINRHGLPVAGDPNAPSFDGRPFPSPNHSKSARYSRKHYTPKAERPANGLYALNDKILRFADVLLIHAEACAMQQKSGPALASLQRVRNRVHLTTDLSLTGWDLIKAVRKERRLEMAYEGDRLYDIRRWKDENGKPVISSIMGPNGSFVKYNTEVSTDPYETKNTTEAQNKGFNFKEDTHMLWPIPANQILLSEGAMKQNFGYF
jgi:hypothetical protein